MKKFLISVLLAATVAAPALAEQHDEHGGGGNRAAPAAPQQQRAPAPQAQAPRGNWQGGGGYAWHGYAGGAPRAPLAQPSVQAQGNWNRGFVGGQGARPVFAPPTIQAPQAYQQDRRGQPNGQQPIARNDQHFDHGGAQRDWHQGNHDQGQWARGDHGQWNRGWRNDQRYNWQAYRDYNRDFFHVGAYYNPYGYGYGYQTFGVGIYLDAPFYGTDYWINDPYDYRLPEAYGDTRWVRYYNDVVLVDIDTGEVLDVIHNFFW